MSKAKKLISKLETHCEEWVHFPESADKAGDTGALNQLDADMNAWFSKLEDIVQELEKEVLDVSPRNEGVSEK